MNKLNLLDVDDLITNIQNRLLISPLLPSDKRQTLTHENPTVSIQDLFGETEMKEFEFDLRTIQLNADWETQFLHNPNQPLPLLMPCDEFLNTGVELVMKSFTFTKQNVDN
jgi:hypothetical protein